MIDLHISLGSMKESDLGQLLKDAVKQNRVNSLPVGRRKKAMEDMAGDETCSICGGEDCKCDADNAAKVAMHRRGVKSSLPDVTSEDLPRGMNLRKYAKGQK